MSVDQKQLDEKIDQFSEELVGQFGELLKGIKGMKELLPAGRKVFVYVFR